MASTNTLYYNIRLLHDVNIPAPGCLLLGLRPQGKAWGSYHWYPLASSRHELVHTTLHHHKPPALVNLLCPYKEKWRALWLTRLHIVKRFNNEMWWVCGTGNHKVSTELLQVTTSPKMTSGSTMLMATPVQSHKSTYAGTCTRDSHNIALVSLGIGG